MEKAEERGRASYSLYPRCHVIPKLTYTDLSSNRKPRLRDPHWLFKKHQLDCGRPGLTVCPTELVPLSSPLDLFLIALV